MSLPLENLDDKTYAELVRDALARIPTYAPRWTDRNESDPGVTFIELFAWLADMQIYSLNRVEDRTRLKCLKLLGVPRTFPTRPAEMYLKFTYTPAAGIDSAFYNNALLDLSRDSSGKMHVYPFGRRPQTGDVFYFSKGTELSKPGVEVSLNITLESPKPISASPPVTADLSWHYYNGSGWAPLSMIFPGTSTNAQDFKDSGTIKFICPNDIQESVVNGVKSYWIRVILASGNYGAGPLYTNYTPPCLNEAFFLMISSFDINSGAFVSGGGSGGNAQVYFEVDDDVTVTSGGSGGQATAVVHAVQGRTVTKTFDLDKTPNLGTPSLQIKLYDRLVLQEYIVRVKVGGETWQWVDDLSTAAATDKCYVADMKNKYVLFGDGIHGMAPTGAIEVYNRASEGFITRQLTSYVSSEQVQVDLTDRAPGGGCPKDPVLWNIIVKVDGDTWTADTAFPDNPSSKYYVVDSLRWIIKFGDGSKGMIPPSGASMTITYNFQKSFVKVDPDDPDSPLQPQVTGSITRDVISPGEAGFRLNLLDDPERLSLGDELKVKVQELSVKVAGETWQWVDDLSTAAATDKNYKADLKNGLITFGNGTHGMVPPSGKEIIVFHGGSIGYVTLHLTSDGSSNFEVSLEGVATNLCLDARYLTVKVGSETWTSASSFTGKGPTDKCYVIDSSERTIQFGDGIRGMIPPNGASLTIIYYRGPVVYATRHLSSTGSSSLQVSLKNVATDLYLDASHLTVKVDNVDWTAASSFTGKGPADKCYVVDSAAGTITFGDGIEKPPSGHGMIPLSGAPIAISYTSKKGPITRDVVSPGMAGFTINLLDGPQRDDLLWLYKEDLDASRYEDKHFTADPEKGILIFGNGDPADQSGRGRVPISSSIITATYRTGVGVDGNLRAGMIDLIQEDPSNQSVAGMTVTNVEQAKGGKDAETLTEAIVRARKELLEVTRSITASDYETLVAGCPRVKLARVKVLPQFHPILGNSLFDLVSVVIVPVSNVMPPIPSDDDCARVRKFLEQYRTLGTNLYVIKPTYTRVKIKAKVVRDFKYFAEEVQEAVQKALHSFLNPLTGGPDRDGWPFGKQVYQSEIMQIIDNVAGVDHVSSAEIWSWSEKINDWELAGDNGKGPLEIDDHELVYSRSEYDHEIDATEAVA